MKHWLVQSLAPFATVAVVVGIAAFCGCEKKPEVYTVRGEDPVYRKTLHETRTRQNEQAAVRARIEPQLKELIARARAALPKDATDEQVRAELEAHPERYPGWKALSGALAKANANLEQEMARARATVRARILKEAADCRAVAEGRATDKSSAAAKK